MYCPDCREERLTVARVCAICGQTMAERSQDELTGELAHVHYVLQDAAHWGQSIHAEAARNFVLPHFQRRERLLVQALSGEVERVAPRPGSVHQLEPVAPRNVPVPLGDQGAAPPDPFRPVEEPILDAVAVPEQQPYQPPPEVASLPVGGEPIFDIPSRPGPVEEAVEAVSTWRSVWRPFLYESIGWFIGAFLVVTGSVYFVALGWSGMSTLGRGLTIFGLAAGYSAAFSVVGALLLRREGLAGAGRVVSLIGSAMAPFAPLALGPVARENPVLFWGLTLGWAGVASLLMRSPARAYDPPSVRGLQWGMAVTVLSVGAAPLLVQWLGTMAVWTALWTLVLVAWVQRSSATRTVEAAAFAFLAPAYLAALALIRLHLAIGQGGTALPPATYAPFAAAFLWLAVRAWPRAGEKLSAAAGVATVAGQLVCVVAAGFGQVPAFFATSALLTWTSRWLGRHARGGARWFYVTYAAGYLAYQSVGQLVPGWVDQLLLQIKGALGIASGEVLPFNYAAVYALPYVLAGALWAWRLLRRPEQGPAAEVLLKATAAATLFFSVEAAFGTDLRPAVWSVPPLALIAVALGLRLDRPYLTGSGWAASLIAPVAVSSVFGPAAGALAAGVFAMGWSLLARFVPGDERHRLSIGALLQTLLAAALAWSKVGDPSTATLCLLALLLAAAAAWLSALWSSHRWAEGWALILTLSVAPFVGLAWAPAWAPLALAAAALVASFLPLRSAPWLAVAAAIIASLWQWDLQQADLGPVLLLGVATAASAGFRVPALGVPGAVFWTVALWPSSFRPEGMFHGWPHFSELQSTWVLALTAAAASVVTGLRGRRTPAAVAYAATAVLGLLGGSVDQLIGVPDGSLVVAAVGMALSSRALRGEICLPLAALTALVATVALGHVGFPGYAGRLLLALLLTALVLLDRLPALRERVLGGTGATFAAALSAFVVLIAAPAGQPGGIPNLVLLAAITLLPLVWLWATRSPVFAGAPVLLGAGSVITLGVWTLWVPVIAVVAVTYWKDRPAVSRWVQGSVALATGLLLVALLGEVRGIENSLLPITSPWICFSALGAGALLTAGIPISQRLMLAGVALALAPGARGPGSLVLAGLGFALLHAGDRVRGWLRAPEEEHAPKYAGAVATVLAFIALWDAQLWGGWMLAPAVALLLAALLLEDTRLVTLASISLGVALSFGRDVLPLPFPEPVALLGSALFALLLAAIWRIPSVRPRWEAVLFRLSPGIDRHLDRALWLGGAVQLAGWVLSEVVGLWSSTGTPLEPTLAIVAGLLLWVAASRTEWVMAAGLWAAVIAVALPSGTSGMVLAASGLLLTVHGWRRPQADFAAVRHHAGWALGLFALLCSGGLGNPLFPLVVLLSLGSAWAVVARSPRWEWLGWSASLVAAHLWMFHLGKVFSSGRGEEFILPFLALGISVVVAVAALLPGSPVRRWVVLLAGALACVDVVAGLLLISGGGPREASAAAVAMVLLFVMGVLQARRDHVEAPAFLAQGALLLAYLAIRHHGFEGQLDGRDGLAALVAGALFSGLHVHVRRHAETLAVFRRPALFGAYLFPLVGLLAAPWEEPLMAAMLLIGHAAHFTVLAGTGARKLGSLVAAAAFNLALYLAWLGSHAGQAEYYVIPFGLSLLVLAHVFRHELDEGWQARLRAVAITTIYSASAWRALLFSDAWALGICALACVLGVAAGIALRIRSFVYLGTGFLVTSVVANLIRAGVSQPHLGALFLSVLGVLVVGFMVLFTARRAELIRRYERMRALMAEWEG